MKRSIRIACILLVFAMLTLLFAGCQGKSGMVVAAYDGKPIYESEVQSIVNYYVISRANVSTTEDEKIEIAQDAVRTYVKYKVLELDLAKQGFKVDEKELRKDLKATIKELNETTEGGYADWRNMYQVDKNFLKEELRRFALAQLFREFITEGMNITDEQAKRYFNANGDKYTDPAGYTWTAVLLEVKDLKNDAEATKMKSEAEEYIRQLRGGFTDLDTVKADVFSKYTEADGYTQTSLYSGENMTSMIEYTAVPDLSAALAKIDEEYGEVDPSADEKTDLTGYTKYMNYISDRYKAEVFYALGKLNAGEVYSEPIKSVAGYFIVRLDRVKEKSGFKKFEDVKDSIIEEMTTIYVEEEFSVHVASSLRTHNAQFIFDDEQ